MRRMRFVYWITKSTHTHFDFFFFFLKLHRWHARGCEYSFGNLHSGGKKFTLEQTVKAQEESRGIALLFL
jgi:hypothetical protein